MISHTIGLENLGNLSYLNSVIQLLCNIPEVMQYFVSNRYLSMLNTSSKNSTGSYGILTCAFADTLKRLWFHPEGTRFIDPKLFRDSVSEYFDDYKNN